MNTRNERFIVMKVSSSVRAPVTDSPWNDVAPSAYNAGAPRPGLPTSPLTISPRDTGFVL